LLDSIAKALAKSLDIQQQQNSRAIFTERASRLSPRERQVMDVLVVGKHSKEIASEASVILFLLLFQL